MNYNFNKRKIKYIQQDMIIKSSQSFIGDINKLYSLEIHLDTMTGYIVESRSGVVLELQGNDLKHLKRELKRRLIKDFNVLFEDYISSEVGE